MTLRIATNSHRIQLIGELDLQEFRRVLATMYALTKKQGYQELLLDFAECTYVAPGAMAAVVAEALRLRTDGIDTTVMLPADHRLRKLFMNAGWAHFLEPTRYEESRFVGFTHVPLSQFGSSTEQGALVNNVMDTLLKSTTRFAREDFAAVEWTMNELADNVLNHSQSPVGGLVHLNNFADKRRVEFIVADPGVGIPRTLKEAIASIRSDSDALEQAIREGVTRSSAGQGNGLYGSYRIAESSGGYFYIHSGYASLEASRGYLKIFSEAIPYAGTLVISGMDYSRPNVLANALQFGGKAYTPSDYIELKYEMDAAGVIAFDLAAEASSFGSRDAGSPVRMKLFNLYRVAKGLKAIVINVTEVPLVSSSFADEIFGKLFLELGPMEFMRAIRIEGANPTVQELINRAILQRSRGDIGE